MTGPRWAGSTLVAGAVLLVFWAIFVLSFKAEPSAVGRTRVALDIIGGASFASASAGLAAAGGLFQRTRWSTSAAWFASVLLILTVVSSGAGIATGLRVLSRRDSPTTDADR